MKGPFAKIEQDLAQYIDQQLLSDIYAYREKRLARIAGIIDGMLDMSSHSSTTESMARGIEELQAFLMNDEYDAIHEQIITDIFVLKNELPEKVVFHQTPEHFEPFSSDNLRTKTIKRGKRLIRSMGKTEWLQKVPLQNVVAYHLLDSGLLFKDWLAAEERLLMQIILELDQVLDHAAQDTTDKSNNTELIQLLKVVQNEIGEAQRTHKKKLQEARAKLMQMFTPVFSTVGTLERRAGFYTQNRVLQGKERLRKKLDEYQEKWKEVNTQLLERTSALYRFIVFCENLEQATHKFKADIANIFNRSFHDPHNALTNKISSVRRQAVHLEQPLAEVLFGNNHSLIKTIQKQLLEPLKESIDGAEIQQRINLYADELKEQALELPGEVTFITDIDRGENPPKIKSKKIEWTTLINQRLHDDVLDNVSLGNGDIETFMFTQMNEAQEVEGIIEVNFESALDLTKKRSAGDDPYKVVDEALDRAQSKIDKFESKAEKAQKELLKPLDSGIQHFKSAMFEMLYQADANTLKLLDTKYKMNEKTHGWRSKLNTRWAQMQNRGAVMARFGWKKSKAYYNKSSTWLGLNKPEAREEKKADITAYLTETEQRFEELPYIYRQLFDFKAIPDERYYVGLNENFGYMQEALDHWQNGLSATMAVVGEKGSGKSTYLDLVKSKVLAAHNVLHISLDDTIWTTDDLLAIFAEQFPEADFSSIDTLVQFLKEKQEHRIIIFEGVQNLYIRQINGYDAIEQFVYLVAETADDIFWLISCSRYAWSFLSKAVNIKEYFSYLIENDTLSKQQMQKAIMSRHQASGYELVFVSSESDAKSRSYKKMLNDEEKAQEHLKDKYFDKLAELSEGNTSVGMILWLRSIEKFDDTHCFIAPLEVASLEMLENMNPRTLFILASLVLHDTLHPEELAVIQTMNAQEGRMALKRLRSRGIIVESDHGYFLNHLIYRQVIDELKERNILHL